MNGCLIIFAFFVLMFGNVKITSVSNGELREKQLILEENTSISNSAKNQSMMVNNKEIKTEAVGQIRNQMKEGFRLIPGTSDGMWQMLEPE